MSKLSQAAAEQVASLLKPGEVLTEAKLKQLHASLAEVKVKRKEYNRRTPEQRADDARKELVLVELRGFYSRIRDYGTAAQCQEARNALADIVKKNSIRQA